MSLIQPTTAPASVALIDLTQRINGMEQKWADLGYPVDSSEVIEESPLKKIKLENDQNSTPKCEITAKIPELTSYVLEGLSNKIEVLEEKWKTMFADVANDFSGNGESVELPKPIQCESAEVRVDVEPASLMPLELSVNEQVLELLTERVTVLEKQWSNYFDVAVKTGVPEAEQERAKSSASDISSGSFEASPTSTDFDPVKDAIFEKSFKCRMCSEVIPLFKNLRYHLKTHHQLNTDQVLECHRCRLIFASPEEFSKHMESHNTSINVKLTCTLCNVGSLQGNALRKHFRGHMFKNCDPCHETFKRANAKSIENMEDLITHLAEHIGTETNPVFKCEQCRLLFTTITEETEHFHLNHDLNCQLCNRKKPFNLLHGLHTHLQHVHGIPDASAGICPICSEVFLPVTALMTHVLKQHKGKLTTCEFCKNPRAFFAPEEQLEAHMLRYHSNCKQMKRVQVKLEDGK